MKHRNRTGGGTACTAALILSAVIFMGGLASSSAAQQKQGQTTPPQNEAYAVSRETLLQGTVVNYTADSSTAPLGAHVTVQTTSGVVDVHLGNSQLLDANHFSLAPGDSVRIVGENLAYGQGTQFFARLIEKGGQSVALRSVRGFPLRPKATSSNTKAGVL
jgi:hypothetical protein